MKKIILFALVVLMSFSLVYAQQEKTKIKRKVMASGTDYELVQVTTTNDTKLADVMFELAGTNFKYPIETEFKKIFSGDFESMKLLVDSAYNFMLKSNDDSKNMYQKVQFVAIPKAKQGTYMMIVSSSDMMHLFQKSQLENLLKSLKKIENQK